MFCLNSAGETAIQQQLFCGYNVIQILQRQKATLKISLKRDILKCISFFLYDKVLKSIQAVHTLENTICKASVSFVTR